MAKTKVKKHAEVMPQNIQQQAGTSETEEALFDLCDPEGFRKAFIASEILNRKY